MVTSVMCVLLLSVSSVEWFDSVDWLHLQENFDCVLAPFPVCLLRNIPGSLVQMILCIAVIH